MFTIAVPGAKAAGEPVKLRLSVEDQVSAIEAIPVKDVYYVPLRLLTEALNGTVTGLPEGIAVNAGGGSFNLMKEGGVLYADGTTAAAETFNRNGMLMVPLRLFAKLGYSISYSPSDYLLRIRSASATLDDPDFINRYAADLKPPAPVSPAPAAGTVGKTVYLTFDDGPSASTGQLLDLLDKYGVKATFFMLGPNMNRYPAAVKRIAQDGHGLGLHGTTHRKEKFYASPAAALGEMVQADRTLAKLTGTGTSLIRPPYGSKPYFTQAYRDKVLAQGFHLWDWNVDSDDWMYKEDRSAVYGNVMSQVHKLKKAGTNPVILMHDQKADLAVLPHLLESLKQEGYTFEVITGGMTPVNFWKDKR